MAITQGKWAIHSTSPEQTLTIGQAIGALTEPNTVITLSGNLGAGKTWLAKGIAFGLGVPDYEYVNSPAYDLVHEYAGRLKIFHLDLYRLDTLSTDDWLMIQEFYGAGGVCLIEWPSRLEKYPDSLPAGSLAITIETPDTVNENSRQITIAASDEHHQHLLERLAQTLTA